MKRELDLRAAASDDIVAYFAAGCGPWIRLEAGADVADVGADIVCGAVADWLGGETGVADVDAAGGAVCDCSRVAPGELVVGAEAACAVADVWCVGGAVGVVG